VILDGKALAAEVRAEVARGAAALKRERGIVPGLAAVRVGEDAGSAIYVRNKRKACEEVGMASWEHHFPEDATQAELLALVARLNADAAVHGVLIQLPHPKQLDSDAIVAAVDPRKDCDGFHPLNAGALFTGRPGPRPCTPAGVMRLLDRAGVKLQGTRALVVGRSNIVGKPVALMLLERHATVTVAHSRTADLAGEVSRADVVVAAVGRAELVKGAWIKEGATVIDVGINRGADGKLRGDVEFAEASSRAAWITPVPGGVGPMTIAMLLQNTLELARRSAA
jgi:methylenetetrahydrofolate dehydrogenase (NADP+)/methenyltetrahydrofolate cyclohydrolase